MTVFRCATYITNRGVCDAERGGVKKTYVYVLGGLISARAEDAKKMKKLKTET